ncbi:cysteine proteinase [Lindgomyces ingoldianus]|uniref:Cysteine proteinase n=1 Tax=Lindgomyces ingoldianus TaxID=673940 RepID=A0ACB6QQ25_9PLEO|nr:cysteine proteinase [Lindgomyces ingoldianus]KAF2468200.1 cysteine proteinase [Lindgomyces ingoldianus]
MTSFFGRFKGTSPASPASSNTPAKKDPHLPQPTPLEKLLADAGPLRGDGSDKFFGFENFGSTCYCNSIIQCLYYSVPFREQVINFPSRSPPEVLERPAQGPLPRLNTDLSPLANSQNAALSPKGRNSISSPSTASPRKPVTTPGAVNNPQGMKPEDNKDSPEYKKKMAMAAGPVLTMDYENSKAYGMSESLFTSLKDIFEAVIAHRSRMGVVSPNKFLEILRRENEMFRTPMHQDAHEFLNLLLNEVMENVEQFSRQRITEVGDSDSKSDSNALSVASTQTASVPDRTSVPSLNNTGWVHELFEGTLTSETRCLTCENTSQRDEAFLDLSVDLDQHSSVTSCLRKFSEEEMLCERNKFHCDNCGGLQEAEKRMKIKRLPRILALHLKRFKYTEDLQRLQKLFHRVVYPYYLRLFNTTDDAEDPDRLYELYAVVVHIGGGPYHGHYVSIIKTQDRGWLLFDDEMVEPVDKAYVRNFFGGENALACAYVLFYQETTLEAMQKEQEAEGLAAAKHATELHQEPLSAAIPKQNGVANGHPLQHATTPVVESEDQFVSLGHAATAPPIPHDPHNPPENIVTSIPILSPKKSNLQSKKEKAEKAKEEKEKKAQEKELEKQAKQKRKEMELKRRENYKKQEEDLRAALAASKLSAKNEADLRRSHTQVDGSENLSEKEPHVQEKEKENGFTSKGGLSRFRHSSMSIRHKPKFWSHRDKHESEAKTDTEHVGPQTPGVETGSQDVTPNATPDKPEKEKSKNRFSLGRKKSTFHL